MKNQTKNPIDHVNWANTVQDLLKAATQKGASAAEISASVENGFSVNVRLGEVETVEYHRDKNIGMTVYFGQQKGSASTTDTTPDALFSTLNIACEIAKVAQPDPYAGLADKTLLATEYPDLDLYHPWHLSPEQAIEIAKTCEGEARAFDKRISNSEGCELTTHDNFFVYGNTQGFIGGYPTSDHTLSCVLIAQQAGQMQRDYGYTVSRVPQNLRSPSAVAKEAAEKTLRRLNARRVKSCHVPVIFEAGVARGILGAFIGAIRGGNLYRKASFLVDHLGKPIFGSHVNIYEHPHLLQGLASTPFDNEGVATTPHTFIKEGVLQNYVLSSYAARKLGMKTTGNAGGVFNLFIDAGDQDLPQLLKKMGKGLLVTEVMGQGVNIVTGDYSRGAAGFWVEHGEIQYPVHEITIAGNLRDMFLHLVAVGNDIDHRDNIQTGSILIEEMSVGGE